MTNRDGATRKSLHTLAEAQTITHPTRCHWIQKNKWCLISLRGIHAHEFQPTPSSVLRVQDLFITSSLCRIEGDDSNLVTRNPRDQHRFHQIENNSQVCWIRFRMSIDFDVNKIRVVRSHKR